MEQSLEEKKRYATCSTCGRRTLSERHLKRDACLSSVERLSKAMSNISVEDMQRYITASMEAN